MGFFNGHATGVPKFMAGTDSKPMFEAYEFWGKEKIRGCPKNCCIAKLMWYVY